VGCGGRPVRSSRNAFSEPEFEIAEYVSPCAGRCVPPRAGASTRWTIRSPRTSRRSLSGQEGPLSKARGSNSESAVGSRGGGRQDGRSLPAPLNVDGPETGSHAGSSGFATRMNKPLGGDFAPISRFPQTWLCDWESDDLAGAASRCVPLPWAASVPISAHWRGLRRSFWRDTARAM
jgi:hypothetical protein